MASRYMNYMRKNAKVVLVFMGIVCMVTFVVGSALIDLATRVRNSASEGERDPVVVTWAKGGVKRSELEMLRHRHRLVYGFLYRVIDTAVQRGGKPIVNGRPINPNEQIDVGIPENNSDESTIQTMVLAEEARRMGIVVDTNAVKEYLKQISWPELKEGDWYDIASEMVSYDKSQSVTVAQLLEHLAYELKAQHVRMLALAGYYAHGVGPIVPPGEAYDLFNRLNRRLTIEAYPVDVASFIDQVKEEPPAAEVQRLFDEGKYRDPDPNINEPGFHNPHKLAFTYLKVSFAPFLEEAKKQITEEQVKEAYDKDIGQGLHKVQELPPATPPAGEKKDGDKATEEKPADEKPSDQKPADASEKPAQEKEKSPSAPPADKPAEKSAKNDGQCGDADEAQAENKTANTEDAAKEKSEKPADEKKPTEEKPAEAKPEEEKKSDTSEAPAKEQKFKPLEEVRDQIVTRLAQPIAEDARKKAVGEIVAAIEKYGKAYRRYLDVKNVRKTGDVQEPGKLDLAPLAAKYNFPIGETPLVDRYEIANFEIGQKAQELDREALQMRQFRMLTFADIAYGANDRSGASQEPLYKPEEIRSSDFDSSYIYFRTAEEKPADVTLKDVRPQVVSFWKKQKAFELAVAEAKKLAEKAKGLASIGEVVPDPLKVVVTKPFAWMSSSGFGMFGRPELSQVPEINLPGQEFMQAVFALQQGQTGPAPNQAHSKVYVAKVLKQDPDDERLRSLFLDSGYNQLVIMLAQTEAGRTSYEWYRGVAKQYNVKWQRPPQEPMQM
jgi:hypothetical protein